MKRSFAWFAVGMLLMPAMLLAHMLPARRSGSLKGLVTDSAGVPLRGATIRLIGTSPLRGGIAAPNGAYAIPLLAPGFYRVKVTMVGRGPIELPGVRIGAGRATVADFTLIFVPILGDTIEVRALPSTRPEAIPQGEHAFLPAPGVGCRSFHDVAEREPNSSSVTGALAVAMLLNQQVPTGTAGMLKGRVVDDKGRPIARATVIVEGSAPLRGAYTRSDGSYMIAGIRPGSYTLKASCIGHRSSVRENVRIDADRTIPIDFTLAADTAEKGTTLTARPELLISTRTSLGHALELDSVGLIRQPIRQYRTARPLSTAIHIDGLDTVATDSTAPRRNP